MRLWHKDLIKLLPDELLIKLYGDCRKVQSLLDLNIQKIPEVDAQFVKVIEYPIDHFYTYFNFVVMELKERKQITKSPIAKEFKEIEYSRLFDGWHTTRYLQQCVLILEEMYDCNAISYKDWFTILNGVKNTNQLCAETLETLFT